VRKFKQITEFIGKRTVTIKDDTKQIDFARLDFEIDKRALASQGQVAISKFIIERRAGVDFEHERYFSSAPMTTANHIQTLEEIERVAASA
jgi:hypothetical protein